MKWCVKMNIKFPSDNKFQLGSLVVYKDKTYCVTGINLHLGYDMTAWEYNISKPLDYECIDVPPWASRCDVDNRANIKEHELLSLDEYVVKRKAELKAEIDRLNKEKEKIENEIAGLTV